MPTKLERFWSGSLGMTGTSGFQARERVLQSATIRKHPTWSIPFLDFFVPHAMMMEALLENFERLQCGSRGMTNISGFPGKGVCASKRDYEETAKMVDTVSRLFWATCCDGGSNCLRILNIFGAAA